MIVVAVVRVILPAYNLLAGARVDPVCRLRICLIGSVYVLAI